jgi:hypothetical protein
MSKQLVVLVVGIVIVVFVFAVPVQPVVGSCLGSGNVFWRIHYLESLSCNVVQIGDIYWHAGLQMGCGHPLIPN